MAQVNSLYNTAITALVGAGQCVLAGMYVNSTNVGTIKLYNIATATTVGATVINNTITPAIGYHNLGNVLCETGLYAVLGGTAIDVTFYLLKENR